MESRADLPVLFDLVLQPSYLILKLPVLPEKGFVAADHFIQKRVYFLQLIASYSLGKNFIVDVQQMCIRDRA